MNALYVDIETIPDAERADLFMPDLIKKLTDEAGENPDPDIIMAQAETRASWTPEMLKIVGLNLAIDEGEPKSGWVGETSDELEEITESMLLKTFWRLAAQADHVVGFNCLRFDIPAILIRSAILGIYPTVPFFAQKPWDEKVIDLAAKRVQFGRFDKNQWHSLKALRRLYNLPVPADLQEVTLMDGGDVGALYEQFRNGEDDEGRTSALETLKNYGKLDIVTTKELCRFWGSYFYGMIAQPRLAAEENDDAGS